MTTQLPLTSRSSIPPLARAFALAALVLWLSSLVPLIATADGRAAGVGLVLGAILGWAIPAAGTWAVYANISIVWAIVQLLDRRRPRFSVWISVALPILSPLYWVVLVKTPLTSKSGIVSMVWSLSIVCLVCAYVLSKPSKDSSPAVEAVSPALEQDADATGYTCDRTTNKEKHMGIGTRDESTQEFIYSKAADMGHWYRDDDDNLYIPDDRSADE
jgi:hypothetical protein